MFYTDLIFRPFIFYPFILMTWNTIRLFQEHPEICPDGAVFFGRTKNLTESSVGIRFFFVVTLVTVGLEGIKVFAEVGRTCCLRIGLESIVPGSFR